jgi:hypothetical protein
MFFLRRTVATSSSPTSGYPAPATGGKSVLVRGMVGINLDGGTPRRLGQCVLPKYTPNHPYLLTGLGSM